MPISLFVYYNSSDHLAILFQHFCAQQVPIIKKISSSSYEGRKLTRNSWPLLAKKTTWSDKMRLRAAGVVRRKKITFTRKTRQNSKDLEKKVCRKIPRLSTEIRSTKVGPDLISHGFEVACPYSFSSPCLNINISFCQL